jgi:hypothetical protein
MLWAQRRGRIHLLCADSPNNGTPGRCKSENKQAGENNHGCARSWRVSRGCPIEREVTNRCEDHETNEHPESTKNQRLSSSEMFNNIKTICTIELACIIPGLQGDAPEPRLVQISLKLLAFER